MAQNKFWPFLKSFSYLQLVELKTVVVQTQLVLLNFGSAVSIDVTWLGGAGSVSVAWLMLGWNVSYVKCICILHVALLCPSIWIWMHLIPYFVYFSCISFFYHFSILLVSFLLGPHRLSFYRRWLYIMFLSINFYHW